MDTVGGAVIIAVKLLGFAVLITAVTFVALLTMGEILNFIFQAVTNFLGG